MFSRRTAWDRTIDAWARDAERARARGAIDLTVSNPTAVGLPAASVSFALPDRYDPQPLGAPAARAAIAEYYGRRGRAVIPEQVVLAASTSELYGWLFAMLADPGEAIAIGAPSYPLFGILADTSGVRTAPYPLAFDGTHFAFDADALGDLDARAVVIVSPNNPTGDVLDAGGYAAAAAWCRAHDAALILDEVFLDSTPEPTSHAGRADVLTFTLGGLSKAAALPGAKLSWCVVSGPMTEMEEALARLEILADTALSVNAAVQASLPEILEGAEAVQAALRARLAVNRAELARHAFALPSEAGWSAVLRTERPGLAERLLEADVIAYPGALFDLPFEGLVVSTIGPPERFALGLSVIAATP